MRKIVLISFLLLMPLLAVAEVFSGYIYNKDMEALEKALVLHGKKSAYTDDEGYFLLESNSQEKQLTIYLFGYEMEYYPLSKLELDNKILLRKKDLILEEYTFKAKKAPTFMPKAKEKVIIKIDAEKKALDNVAEVISHESNIVITGTQLPGEKQSASILGHKSKHTLVLLDGIAMNSNGEDFDLSAIPTEIVEKIEIYKNNASSLSGSGGIAGAINITTKKSAVSNNEYSLNAKYGSFNYRKLSASIGQSLSRTSIYAVLSGMKSDNDFKYDYKRGNDLVSLTREHNKKENYNLLFNMSMGLDWLDLYYSNNSSFFNNQLPGPSNFSLLYDKAFIKGYDSNNSFKLSKKISLLNNKLTFYKHYKKSEYDNTSPTNTIHTSNNISKNSKIASKLENTLELSNFSLILSNEYLEESFSFDEKINNNADIPEISQYSTSSALISSYEQEIDLIKVGMNLSGRYDSNNNFGDFTTYRVGGELTHNHIITTTLSGSYGTGFTLPSFYSLYWKGDSQAMGNPDLKPEESEGYQLGLELDFDSRCNLKFNYSHNTIDNLIQWVEVNMYGKVWKPLNIGSSKIENISMEADIEAFRNLHIFGSYVITNTENLTLTENGLHSSMYGKELAYTPEMQIKVGASYEYMKYKAKIEYNKTGKQWITLDNLKDPLPEYELTNIALSKQFKLLDTEHTIGLNFNNIFNKYYEIYAYNPQAPFNWTMSYNISYRM